MVLLSTIEVSQWRHLGEDVAIAVLALSHQSCRGWNHTEARCFSRVFSMISFWASFVYQAPDMYWRLQGRDGSWRAERGEKQSAKECRTPEDLYELFVGDNLWIKLQHDGLSVVNEVMVCRERLDGCVDAQQRQTDLLSTSVAYSGCKHTRSLRIEDIGGPGCVSCTCNQSRTRISPSQRRQSGGHQCLD